MRGANAGRLRETEERVSTKFSKERTGRRRRVLRRRARAELPKNVINFKPTSATNAMLETDRLTRLVLGSCPYHGTSHRALSRRRRALPMAASRNESTPAVA